MSQLIIIGAGGHGKVIADIAQKSGRYESIAFLDDADVTCCLNYKVIGKVIDLDKYIGQAEFFVAIGNNQLRKTIMNKIVNNSGVVATLIHPSAIIGADVSIGIGTAIMAGVVINPCTKIGNGVIINTCSSVDHDCNVGDYCHLAVGVHVAGTVNVGNNCFLGAGTVVINNVNICQDCIIGAGAAVICDITTKGTYVGVPAKIN